MNTCKCGRVVYRSGSRCMSCAKKASWERGDYDDQRDRLRTLGCGKVEHLSTRKSQCLPAGPGSTIDNVLRDAFRQIIGFDPLYDKNPTWKFPKQKSIVADDA